MLGFQLPEVELRHNTLMITAMSETVIREACTAPFVYIRLSHCMEGYERHLDLFQVSAGLHVRGRRQTYMTSDLLPGWECFRLEAGRPL